MKNLKNLNLKTLAMLLSAGICLSSPLTVHAEEGEILYIQQDDEHEQEEMSEETKEAMIEAAEEAEKENAGTGAVEGGAGAVEGGTGAVEGGTGAVEGGT